MIHIDTLVATRLFYGRAKELTTKGRRLVESESMVMSPMVVLELEYLYRRSFTRDDGATIRHALAKKLNIQVYQGAFIDIAEAAMPLHWTRDPFDRLIVANAIVDGARLLTSDLVIREHFPRAVW